MEVYDVALIPLILGLVSMIKGFNIPKRYLPVISLFLGLLVGIFYVYPHDIKGGIISGLMLGLSASGLYSSTKNIVKGDGK